MTDSPRADSVAWMKRPLPIPRTVSNPARRPRRIALRTTSIVSAPGVSVTMAAIPVKARTRASSMLQDIQGVREAVEGGVAPPQAAGHARRGDPLALGAAGA